MHWFDIGVGIALILGGVWSFFRGLTREVLSILGIIAAFVLSSHGYPYVAELLTAFAKPLWLRHALGFGLIFLVTVVLYVLFTKVAHRLVKAAGLSMPDRVLGGLFGVLKVGVIVSALLLMTTQFFPDLASSLVRRSLLAPPFFRAANALATLLPAGTTAEFRRVSHHLLRQVPAWLPRPTPTPDPPQLSTTPPPQNQPSKPDGISEHDARALEKLLRERLHER